MHNEKKRRITDSFVDEYKDIILEKLMEWPPEKAMNWSELGRQSGLTVPNMGQKVKAVATECGIDVALYVGSKSCSSRLSKSKLPGNEISIPCMPTIATLREDVNHLIDSGKLSMGEPCSHYMVVRSSVCDGKLVNVPAQIYGRKIPLLERRTKLLKKQEQFMHLNTDERIDSLSLEKVKSRLDGFHELTTEISDHFALLKKLQRSRTMVLWHDHSTILGSGYLLMIIHTLYDPDVFLNKDEYEAISGKKCAGKYPRCCRGTRVVHFMHAQILVV